MSDFLEAFPRFTFWNCYAIYVSTSSSICSDSEVSPLPWCIVIQASGSLTSQSSELPYLKALCDSVSISSSEFHHRFLQLHPSGGDCQCFPSRHVQLNPHVLHSLQHLQVFDPPPLHARPHPWCCTTESSFGHSLETPHHLKGLSCSWPWQLLTV